MTNSSARDEYFFIILLDNFVFVNAYVSFTLKDFNFHSITFFYQS